MWEYLGYYGYLKKESTLSLIEKNLKFCEKLNQNENIEADWNF